METGTTRWQCCGGGGNSNGFRNDGGKGDGGSDRCNGDSLMTTAGTAEAMMTAMSAIR